MSVKSMVFAGLALAVVSCATPAGNAVAQPLRSAMGAYELEVLVNGAPAPGFFHGGETFVMGRMGERYTLRVWNRSARRVEAVVSVDGRDVIDGKPADFRGKRGYLVPAWGYVDVDGWRLSDRQAAAFRFTTVADSYAGRMGNARNVGVIGVAVFPERVWEPRPRPQPIYPDHHGYGRGYEPPASRENKSADDFRGYAPRAEAQGAPAPSAPPPVAATPAPADAESVGSRGGEASRSAGPGGGLLAEKPAMRRRPGLGTEFGEEVHSQVREVAFVRANSSNPAVMLGVRYNDRDGLIAMGIDVDGPYYGAYDERSLRRSADPFPVSERRYSAPPPGWRRY